MPSGVCFLVPYASTVNLSSSASSFITASRKRIRMGLKRPERQCNVTTWSIRMSTEDRKPVEERNDGRATAGMFGIRLQTNGDVIKFGIIAIAVAYGFKTGLQVLGTPDLLAGQITTGFISVLSLLAWVSTYVFRVGTKGMTYAQQLRDYEDQVIQKRYEELTEEELAALKEELEDDI